VGHDDAASTGVGGGIWKPLEIHLFVALPLPRPHPATTILCHKVGRAVFDDDEFTNFYFLCKRIFYRVAAATRSPAQPSGFVLGWDRGGTVVTRQATGEFSGPDRIREVLTRVLMSTHASVLVDGVGPPSAEVCRAAASFP
jgi:hypothetical protein